MSLSRPASTVQRLSRILVPTTLLALFCFASAAKADTLDYTLTTADETITFSLSTTQTPNTSLAGVGFVYDNIAVSIDGAAAHNKDILFGNLTGPAPVLNIATSFTLTSNYVDTNGNVAYVFGKTLSLYTGSESDPTLATGTFTLGNVGEGTLDNITSGDTLVVQNVSSVAATPEPSSIALLGTALLGVAGTLRRRFQ